MPQGNPLAVPNDGLTTRARRNMPILAVHTGEGKGKSTAAFGMALRAWNAGLDIAVFQFVKSAKWKVGEEAAFRQLGRLHDQHGIGGAVEWHKMGAGWSWTRTSRKAGTDVIVRPRRRTVGPRSRSGWPRNVTTSICWTSSPTH
ncbi:cob(I)alamin adenolsyltransferase/cobinamide ATP-dependent adenolsyltransferase [Mycobacterium tuberculosis CAS/NITR204]|uniref:Cob(I)alamin adenolsyltransferase/cobinamide ATP-dependent adenolsyltransferase n=1 Tax=Mycobacterium tuberculosis CAS/NITR204 TaxID=1310114 RepID=R4MJZ9_MYCTX|nr:cob(I)alamin adenolsyltransferase/cobinamide ATP-dependent adenolsyltransferase [Mycobacterium tuberculosis CAS/NITR204]